MSAYQGVWAYNWVQVLAHNYKKGLSVFVLVMLALGAGSLWHTQFIPWVDLQAVGGSLLVMAGLAAKLLDSVKTGALILLMVLLHLVGLVGVLNWLSVDLGNQNELMLGLVIVETMVVSNLVHLVTVLLREMARGAYQQDALPEAIKLTISPIFLSNLTTALGFAFTAMATDQFAVLAWVVGLGSLLSFVLILSLFPLILLKWYLEFRVGQYEDRHGVLFLVSWLQRHPKLRLSLLWTTSGLVFASGIWLSTILTNLNAVFSMLLATFLVLVLVWRNIGIATLQLASTTAALVLVLTFYTLFFKQNSLATSLFLVPLGIILDDGIHFFSRFLKSKQGFFNDNESAIRFAMASVGRAIWLTTILLISALFVLSIMGNALIQLSSWLTMSAALVASFITMLVIPALLLSK